MNNITVTFTRYGEPDEIVKLCLNSLARQKGVRAKVLFLDQKKSAEIEAYCKSLNAGKPAPDVTFDYVNIPAKSLSYARNKGIEMAKTRYVALCDSDCILVDNWAAEIFDTFKDTGAAIVGTKIIPKWQSPTSWYHASPFIQEFYSLLDISEDRMPVRKVIGASMAVDKESPAGEILFDENLDRQKGTLLSGGDTEFCQKVMEKGGKVMYTPHTFAYHIVSKERINLSWIQKRAYYGGLSRALRKGPIEPFNKKRRTLDYFAIALILPSYAAGFLTGKMKNAHKK